MDGVLNYSEFLQAIRPACSWANLPNTRFSDNFKEGQKLTPAAYYQSPKRELKTERAFYYDIDNQADGTEYQTSSRIKTARYDSPFKKQYPKPKRNAQSHKKRPEKYEWDRLSDDNKTTDVTVRKSKKVTKKYRKRFEPQNASSKAAPKEKFTWETTQRQSSKKRISPDKIFVIETKIKKPNVDSHIFQYDDKAEMKEKETFKKYIFTKTKLNKILGK